MGEKRLTTPLSADKVAELEIGDRVNISGTIFTGRDAAHKRLIQLILENKQLPIDLKDQIIYYVGPAPAKPGRVIGSAGPTTSGRMDAYTPMLLEKGLRGMIGKGSRSEEVKESMVKNKAVYFVAVGGAAALIARSIIKAEVVAYPELGPEAIYRLEVVDFPVIVANDIYNGDLYLEGVSEFKCH